MTFKSVLLEMVGDASDSFDIRVSVRRCYFYDFDGHPVRMWDGIGVLSTSDGNEWMGTIVDDVNMHQTPKLRDPRDGASLRYEFGLPYIDQATFDAMSADASLVEGREMTIYNVLVKEDEGLRPGTSLGFNRRLVMKGAKFTKGLSDAGAGNVRRTYGAFVLCRSIESGRSKFPGGTYTDTSQRERAALLGVANDSGCAFVAGNANRTYTWD